MDKKRCSGCQKLLDINEFYVHRNRCKACKALDAKAYYEKNRHKIQLTQTKYKQKNRAKLKEKQKQYRQNNRDKINAYNNKWHRTYYGYACDLYYGITSRMKHDPYYKNRKRYFTKEAFLKWIFANPNYKRLHTQWVEYEYEFKYSPSVDRVDNDGHYTLENIQIITISENSSKPKKLRKRCEV